MSAPGERQRREAADDDCPAEVGPEHEVRRSKRSLRTPAGSRNAIVGTVIPMPRIDSAAGAFQSSYACQAIAIEEDAVAEERDGHPRPEEAEVAVARAARAG